MDEFDNLIEKEIEYAENKVKRTSDKVLTKLETYALSERILELKDYKFYTMRNKDLKKEMSMYRNDIGYYVPFGDTYIHQWCSNHFRTSDKTIIDRVLTTIQGRTFIDRQDFIHPVNLINLKNGVFNLENGELLKHDAKYNFQGILDISYDKNAICPIWEKAIEGMLPNDEDRNRTQKWFGYQFVRENREQVSHGYVGVTGSGKSMILRILRDLLGENNVTNFELQDFNNSNDYAIGRLYGKYANINYDMSTTPIKDISTFKKLTSGDPIKGRNIYESPFEFKNYAKLSWACNKLPGISDENLESHEFKRRVMITEVVKGHKEDDKDIYYKFRNELPGIFNWAIEGHKLYYEEKGFKVNPNDVPSVWRRFMDGSIDLNNHKTVQKSDDLYDDITKQMKLENQEINLTIALKKVIEIFKDKEMENILNNQLKSVKESLKKMKDEAENFGDCS